MKIIGIIPSRMDSTRFPGKALTDIDGLPMVIRVWKAACESGVFDCVYVATDSPQIASVCRQYNAIPFMTASGHKNPTSRIAEVAEKIDSDLYVMIGGDEPLLTPGIIRFFMERGICVMQRFPSVSAVNAMAPVFSEKEAIDTSNIKVVCDKDGNALYASRTAIPFSGYSGQPCQKFVSIGIYTGTSLHFFVSTPPGNLEIAENFDLLRFLEHRKTVHFININEHVLSVDTPSDRKHVLHILNNRTLSPEKPLFSQFEQNITHLPGGNTHEI